VSGVNTVLTTNGNTKIITIDAVAISGYNESYTDSQVATISGIIVDGSLSGWVVGHVASVSGYNESYTDSQIVTTLAVSGSSIEGIMIDEVLAPLSMANATSGILATRDENWNYDGDVYVLHRDTSANIHAGAYVTATLINGTYRPNWVSCSGA